MIPLDVISEVFDDEAVVVNLKTGAYFGFKHMWKDAWMNVLDGGIDEASITSNMGDCYRVFLSESLIEEFPGLNPIEAQDMCAASLEGFEKHTEIEDLLLIDPIHEVDSQGWPRAD